MSSLAGALPFHSRASGYALPRLVASQPREPMKNDLFHLESEVAVVLGGTGVLCGAMAEALAAFGARVAVLGRNEERGRERIRAIEAVGGKTVFQPADAMSRDSLARVPAPCPEDLRRAGAVTPRHLGSSPALGSGHCGGLVKSRSRCCSSANRTKSHRSAKCR